MTLYDDDKAVPLLTAKQFHEYCLQDEKHAQSLLDILLDPSQPLQELIQKYLNTIQSYISGGESWEDFCQQIRKYNNNILCGHVWTNATISYRCRTCATNPCMSLCPDCFHGGNHEGHDANMFRSVGGGICDCGDVTVMNSTGFCKQHGPNRIPNEQIPLKLIRCAQIVLPRLILKCIHYFFRSAINNQNKTIECCICLNKDDRNPLGLVIRLVDTGVLGVRELIASKEDHVFTMLDDSNDRQSSSKDPFICCQQHSNLDAQQQSSTTEQSKESRNNYYMKHKHENHRTCAQFYEEKLHSMLEIYSEANVSKSLSILWRTGFVIDSCSHSMHLSCYKQYIKSHLKKSYSETDPHLEFKCPMCRQISNGLLPLPLNIQPIESKENPIETVTNILEKNLKPCIAPSITEWLVNFVQKMYLTINRNYRTIDHQEKDLNDDRMALFLISVLRFNLENDLLTRETEHTGTKFINRKNCFRELFYLCNLKYPYLLDKSNISLWQRITGLLDPSKEKHTVPLLLSDTVVLLLQLLLTLPYSINREMYQVLVQALFNLTYIQSLFTIVLEMNKSEQEIWSRILMNPLEKTGSNWKNLPNYLEIISSKFSQTNWNSNQEQTIIYSLESIHELVRQRCCHFLKIAGLIQHHLYQPITWWSSGHVLQSDYLWKNLIKELQLYDLGEPYWFCTNSVLLIENWLDELLISDQQESSVIQKTARAIPLFEHPHFVDLPSCYSDLFRICTQRQCPYCQKTILEPLLCLICGIIYSQKCCNQQIDLIKEHLTSCSGGLNISINIHSTKTLIQRERRYTYWSSIYLDQHGEEDLNLRRGRNLYLNSHRLKLLYSAWIYSHLDQLISRWSTDPYDF